MGLALGIDWRSVRAGALFEAKVSASAAVAHGTREVLAALKPVKNQWDAKARAKTDSFRDLARWGRSQMPAKRQAFRGLAGRPAQRLTNFPSMDTHYTNRKRIR